MVTACAATALAIGDRTPVPPANQPGIVLVPYQEVDDAVITALPTDAERIDAMNAKYGADPNTLWSPGDYAVIDPSNNYWMFYWTGTQWLPQPAPDFPNLQRSDWILPPAGVTGEDAASATALTAAGYVGATGLTYFAPWPYGLGDYPPLSLHVGTHGEWQFWWNVLTNEWAPGLLDALAVDPGDVYDSATMTSPDDAGAVAALNSFVPNSPTGAIPASSAAWATGEYVTIMNTSNYAETGVAHWDGSAWQPGAA